MEKRLLHALSLAALGLLSAMNCRAQDAGDRIERPGPQGIVDGCGVALGPDRATDRAGRLLQATTYRYTPGGGGCHDLVTHQTVADYYPDGKPQAVRHFDACYECEPVPVGEWIWYDAAGNVIRRETRDDHARE